ncbi:Gar1/Naf1 RNA binding region-domain-containing protein [Cadophora sp. MPI-SDFR-AT-0126]|nr:Gar1/Naf1 RNA binding region-domain-containing protein [Leotiomycetes sp. MPI-SDFR-AT-0126]
MENSEAHDSAKALATDNIAHQNKDTDTKPNHDHPIEITATSQDTPMENAVDREVADVPASPPLTHALEALLGGLDPPAPAVEDVPATSQNLKSAADLTPALENAAQDGPTVEQHAVFTIQESISIPAESNVLLVDQNTNPLAVEQAPTPHSVSTSEDIKIDDAPISKPDIESASAPAHPAIPGLFLGNGAPHPVPAPAQNEASPDGPPNAAIPGGDVQMGNIAPGEDTTMGEDADLEEEHPEWEVDSSPIESSSDDSSSDDSSDESEDGDNTYKLLSPEEQARILMEGDGGSDDEGGGKAKGSGTQLRTKNEVPDVVVPKPDVVITTDMPITEVGNVEHIVENIVVIKAKTSGENRALESGSVLCLEDRSVIGVVAEILGPVQKPLYSVMFTNAGEIAEAGLSLGTKVFYSENHSTFVFTQALKAYKGSDASNLHDEEVGDEEMEFSDDEAEAEHKRRVKQKRIERRGGKMQNGGSGRGGHPLQQQHTPHDSTRPISYDDTEEDGPYRPLARPAGFENAVGHGEAPQEAAYTGNYDRQNREQFRGRGRGGDRGRGDRGRGRGRGDRGRGRGGYEDRRGSGYSLPPRPQSYSQPPSAYPPGQYQQPPQARDFSQASPAPPAVPSYFMPPAAYSPQQPQMAWPQFPPQFQQPFQNAQNPWQPPPGTSTQGPPPPGGAFINPAFLPGQWNNQNGQNGGAGGK